jgi:hypothetical protein
MFVWLLQTVLGPVMEAGWMGLAYTVTHLEALLPQALSAVTQMLPLTKPEAKLTVTDVPLFKVMVAPEGTVQV